MSDARETANCSFTVITHLRKDSRCCLQLREVNNSLHIVHQVTYSNNKAKKINFIKSKKIEPSYVVPLGVINDSLNEPAAPACHDKSSDLSLELLTRLDSSQPAQLLRYKPCHEKTCFLAYAKTKEQISCMVTAQLISAFVFTTWILKAIYFLNAKISSL